jgi:hypothetical protein
MGTPPSLSVGTSAAAGATVPPPISLTPTKARDSPRTPRSGSKDRIRVPHPPGAGSIARGVGGEAAGHPTPPNALLVQLDAERRRYVAEGRFREAQDCLDAMRDLSAAQGRRIIAEAVARDLASDAKEQLLDDHRKQTLQFTKLWENSLKDFDIKAEAALEELSTRHRREFEEQEELLRSQIAAKRGNPHFSKHVIRGRAELEQLVELRRYREADILQKQVETLEQGERRKFEEMLSLEFATKTKQLKKKFLLEAQTLKQRIETGRDALLTQRRLDYEVLLQRHMNAVAALEQKGRTDAAKDKRNLSRQLEALLSCPTKASLANLQQTI